MTRSISFLNTISLKNLLFPLMVAILVTQGLATQAAAQTTTSTALPGTTVTSPSPAALPPPVGITATGWNASSIIGQGYNVGGDGRGTTSTLADGIFRLSVDANLASNLQGSCTVDCQYTLSRVSLIGEQISGARSVNQGIGTQSAPVASVAGTNGMFTSSAQIRWTYTPPPAAPAGN